MVTVAAAALVSLAVIGCSGRKESSKDSNKAAMACAARLRELGAGLALYESDFGSYPYLKGDGPAPQSADPVAADTVAGLSTPQNSRCGIQPYALLIALGQVSPECFQCPADADYSEPTWQRKYGFTSWRNSSFAVQPTTQGFDSSLAPNLSQDVVIVGDRPDPGNLASGTANHRGSGNFLRVSGSVAARSERNNIGVDGDEVFQKGEDGFADSWLWWGNSDENGRLR